MVRRNRAKGQVDRAGVLEAIREAGKKIGRAPSWGELRRISGIPESRVRVYFGSLAEAVRAAGLQPGRAGLKIATEDLLEDFARVAAKLGRSPSRNEYVREGKYSAGAFYARFGSWGTVALSAQQSVASPSTACEHIADGRMRVHHGGTETRRTAERSGRESTRIKAWRRMNADERAQAGVPVPHESDKAIAMQWAGAMTALPGELAGKRRVTDAVCAMIVNTLLGEEAGSRWERAVRGGNGENCQRSTQHSAVSIQPRNGIGSIRTSQLGQSVGRVKSGHAAGLALVNGSITSGGLLDPERPVMGPPFFNLALMNAPVNELGVVFLFGMVAGELGFQIEAVQGKYPDIHAKRQIQPGKWQNQRVEVEYESLNFFRHGHDPKKCDVIVCWRHNWPDCPKHIEVIELSRIIGRSGDRVIG